MLNTFINWDKGIVVYNEKENNFYIITESYNFEKHLLDDNYFNKIIEDIKNGYYNFLWDK